MDKELVSIRKPDRPQEKLLGNTLKTNGSDSSPMLKTSEFSRLQLYKIVKYFYPPYVDLKQKERTMQTRHFPILEGSPSPLGTSLLSSGVNFAFFSRSPKATLWIFSQKEKEPLLNLPLDPSLHKTGPIWHVFVQGLIPPFEYVLEIQGEMLLDPYAKALSSPQV